LIHDQLAAIALYDFQRGIPLAVQRDGLRQLGSFGPSEVADCEDCGAGRVVMAKQVFKV
jgi:hypothetical protein